MKTKSVFSIAFLLLSIQALNAQTIHQNEIDEFYATIKLLNKEQGIVASTFLTTGIREDFDTKEYVARIRKRGVKDELAIATATWSRHNRTLAIPEMDLHLVMLRDLTSFEKNYNILTFWKTNGDSLTFDRLDTTAYISGMGLVALQDYRSLSDGSCFILLHAMGGDDDIAFGNYMVLKLPPRGLPTKVYAQGYEIHSSINEDYSYDDLQCNLLTTGSDNNDIQARFISTHVNATHRLIKPEGRFVTELDTVSSDTTIINLQDIIKQR